MTVLLERAPTPVLHSMREPHVLLVVQNQQARYALADTLLEAGFRLTLASSYGLADLLVEEAGGIDLLVTAQPMRELGEFGIAQLVRAVRPDLPILVLEEETAGGAGVIETVRLMMRRWPMRQGAASPIQ